MRTERIDDVTPVAPVADDVEAGNGPVVLVRPGHQPVVVAADEWERLEELACEEETEWWRRDAAERAVAREPPDDGEDGPGLTGEDAERFLAQIRRRA